MSVHSLRAHLKAKKALHKHNRKVKSHTHRAKHPQHHLKTLKKH